jgi:hypothetical protein
MALRNVTTSDTINTFRTTFNTLGTDVGDLATLNTVAKNSIVAAINEAVSSPVTFTIKDGALNTSIINSNDIINFIGSTGITATVSTDTVTILADLADICTGISNATTDTDKFLVADGTTLKYRTGTELRSDISAIGTVSFNVRSYTGNASTTSFAITSGQTTASVIVTENGVVQRPTVDYSIVGGNCIFVAAPESGVAINIRELIVT